MATADSRTDEASIESIRAKPTLRGVSHEISFYVSLAATSWLVAIAKGRAQVAACVVYGASIAILFGVSALYHRVTWTVAGRQRMRRFDHAAIFVMIAGGYTPLFALVPSASGSHWPLAAIWIGAAIGVVKSLLWAHAPKWMTAALCVILGWAVVMPVFERLPVAGTASIGLVVASGIVYSLGAVVYATKRPDPLPASFGYHEVFHALVVLATMLHFGHAVLLLGATASS
ncbi:MAG: putative rane protein hemolysin [Myxococcaceae bacterium]|nr:putative rane protein hemolysin [Myxococcaceae bacterium]